MGGDEVRVLRCIECGHRGQPIRMKEAGGVGGDDQLARCTSDTSLDSPFFMSNGGLTRWCVREIKGHQIQIGIMQTFEYFPCPVRGVIIDDDHLVAVLWIRLSG